MAGDNDAQFVPPDTVWARLSDFTVISIEFHSVRFVCINLPSAYPFRLREET